MQKKDVGCHGQGVDTRAYCLSLRLVRSLSEGCRTSRHDKVEPVFGSMTAPGLSIIIFSFLLLLTSYTSFATCVSAEEVESKAAVVMDATTGRVLYAKNPDLRLLPASTTKLMTALVVLERANLNDITTVTRRAASAPPTKAGLKEGDKVTIETLLYAALMKSANDAAVALAEAVAGSEQGFVTLMNNRAMAIGANDTRYINANGLPGNGQYITAYDLAKIMRQAIKYPTIREILGTRITEISTETGKQMFIKNTNKLLWSDDDVLGGKTGYTRKAKHCFVCAGERDNDTIIVALLGAPRRDLLWKESEALLGFGAKVMSHAEEPVVYFTRSGRDDARATTAAYTQTSIVPEDGKLIKKTKHRVKHRKARVITVKKKSRKNRPALAKNRQKPSVKRRVAGDTSAKKKSVEQEVAKQGENGPQG